MPMRTTQEGEKIEYLSSTLIITKCHPPDPAKGRAFAPEGRRGNAIDPHADDRYDVARDRRPF